MDVRPGIIEKVDRIEALLTKPTLDTEVKEEVENEIPDVYSEIIALESKNAFENHMAQYISQEYRRRQDGEREEPLCSCSSPSCSLKHGEVPSAVRTRGSGLIERRNSRNLVSEFVQDHRGAEVLHEMREEWEKREGELYREVSELHAKLEKARTVGNKADA